jgi:predicted porin
MSEGTSMRTNLVTAMVAGILGFPAAAFAQSSVTISGFLKMSVESLKIDNYGCGTTPSCRAAGTHSSESRLVDDFSRIVFNVVEDLGGGLQAIAQIEWRIAPDNGADGGGAVGNSHVGLRSKSWGRVFVGRQDLHYLSRESNLTVKNDLKADSVSILAFAGGGATAIASASRTPNVIHYTSPDWQGFKLTAAYSTNPAAPSEADLASAIRKGRGWNLNPEFARSNLRIGYSYWSQKADAGANALASPASPGNSNADQRSDRLYGSYRWGGFLAGFAWDKSRIDGATGGVELSRRTAWSLPLEYHVGRHTIAGHYTRARDDRATAARDGAKMIAIGYAYDLSKRTSLGVTYARITNDAGAFYNFYTSTSAAVGSPSGAVSAVGGEDPRLISATVRHAF